MMSKNKISVTVIARNEAKRLKACLDSLTWADEIIIVDSGSEDDTAAVAKRYTDKIFQRELTDFASQKNFAADQAAGEWILSVDADEIVSGVLKESILASIGRGPAENGFYLTRKNFIFGKSLRYAGQSREKILRLYRKGKGRFVQPIHEKVEVQGAVGCLEGELEHKSSESLTVYLEKLVRYTDFEADLLKSRNIRPTAARLYLEPPLRFIYFYIFRLGFLDGYEGFLYHSLSSFYHFLKYAKLKEMTENSK